MQSLMWRFPTPLAPPQTRKGKAVPIDQGNEPTADQAEFKA